ncbi:MAG: hypothetical protein ACXWQO_14485 [Bdellovibrionota bacterium]
MKYSQKFLFSLALVGFLSAPAFAEEKKAEEKKTEVKKTDDVRKLVCHGPHEERTLEIVSKGVGCVLMYTKQKETKEMAKAQSSLAPCQAAMQKIRTRLESGNFACE